MNQSRWPQWLPLREDLQELVPYGAPQLPSLAQLNTNENPYPPSRELVQAIAKRVEEVAGSLNRYPDREAIDLRSALANFLNELSGLHLSAKQIWAANGSNEVIQSLFLAFGGRGALGFTPSYSMHPLIARVTGTSWINGERREDFTIDAIAASAQILSTRASLIFVTTPNNPTGTAISLTDLEIMAKAAGSVGGLLVVDEAYAEFSQEHSALDLLEKYPHLVVIRTMSKAFAFAGARVGYLAGDEEVVNAMQIVRLPYHLSALTQAVALVALEHRKELLSAVETLIASRQWVSRQLESLGVKVVPSSANFLLFTVPSSQEIWQSLLDQGVLVRDVGLSGYLRVTIGNEAENERFISALRNSLGGK
ncbi:MAG: histidinol-phosphate transaminase [Actinomycetota bacterium]